MHFCQKCDNMLYIRLLHEDSNDLVYYCRNCGESELPITKENICVSRTDIVIKDKAYLHDINQYTKLDPTLPRTNNIRCPNQSCPSNHTAEDKGATSNKEIDANADADADANADADALKKSEVIYYRYDDKNLKYIYICTLCDKMWNTGTPR